jgi:hypothetical protein
VSRGGGRMGGSRRGGTEACHLLVCSWVHSLPPAATNNKLGFPLSYYHKCNLIFYNNKENYTIRTSYSPISHYWTTIETKKECYT